VVTTEPNFKDIHRREISLSVLLFVLKFMLEKLKNTDVFLECMQITWNSSYVHMQLQNYREPLQVGSQSISLFLMGNQAFVRVIKFSGQVMSKFSNENLGCTTNYQSEQSQAVGTIPKQICDQCDCCINTRLLLINLRIYIHEWPYLEYCALIVMAYM